MATAPERVSTNDFFFGPGKPPAESELLNGRYGFRLTPVYGKNERNGRREDNRFTGRSGKEGTKNPGDRQSGVIVPDVRQMMTATS